MTQRGTLVLDDIPTTHGILWCEVEKGCNSNSENDPTVRKHYFKLTDGEIIDIIACDKHRKDI